MLWLVVHITIFYKGMHEILMQLISKNILYKIHVSLYATTCSLCQLDENKVLKQRVAREMIPFLNHLNNFLYSFGSKFLTPYVGHM
jgi:hypothetical protein